MKKLLLILLVCLTTAGFVMAEGNQEDAAYPKRDITFIIGFGAGGGTDTTGRLFIEALEKQIPNVNLVPTNMAGAAGTVGASHVYNAKPDGYTLFIAHPGIPVPYLRGKFDKTYEDYTPIATFADSTVAMYVKADSPYKTLDDIVAAAQAAPGSIIMGASIGNLLHLASLHMADHNDAEFKIVSIGGGQPFAPELLSGRVETFLSSVAVGSPYVLSGDFRALAVYGANRADVFPNVPTFKELGHPYTFEQSFGLWAPPGTPAEVIDYLEGAVEKACEDPEFIAAVEKIGIRSGFRETDEYKDLLATSFSELKETATLLE